MFIFTTLIDSILLKLCLRRNGRELSKGQQIDEPDADEDTEEVLADEVDTDEVEGEKSAAGRHQLVETDLVNEVTSQKLGHAVDHSTARCETLDIYPQTAPPLTSHSPPSRPSGRCCSV